VDVGTETGDLASMEDEAVTRLGRLMNISVKGESAPGDAEPSTHAAYEDYLAGIGYFQRYDRPGNIDLAITSLQKALKTDPNFALGYARLAQIYTSKYLMSSDSQWLHLAEENGKRAVRLDDRIPATYVALGQVHELTGNHDLAIQEFQRAISLDPRDAEALSGIANSYKNAGRNATTSQSVPGSKGWKSVFGLLGLHIRQDLCLRYQDSGRRLPERQWRFITVRHVWHDPVGRN
jgi:serine/threonine-protein kinase